MTPAKDSFIILLHFIILIIQVFLTYLHPQFHDIDTVLEYTDPPYLCTWLVCSFLIGPLIIFEFSIQFN